jgi:predicted transport protein
MSMADPQTAVVTQLKNIQSRSGKTIAELLDAIRGSGLAKHGERRTWLMDQFQLGYGDANTVVHFLDKPLPPLDGAPSTPAAAAEGDPLDAIYSGAKAHLRPLHEKLQAKIDALGPHQQAPKKTYISLRRKKQFAMLGPATKDQLELGLNIKQLPSDPRLKAQPPGKMCNYTVRFGSEAEIDMILVGWIKAAYEAAG